MSITQRSLWSSEDRVVSSVTELMRVLKITKDLSNTNNGAQTQDKKKGGGGTQLNSEA